MSSLAATMWKAFTIGFWHPFGPYTGRSTREVLDWKAEEVDRHGWTFWSFVYSPTADLWLNQLQHCRESVYVLCSNSPGARDPDLHRGTRFATRYQDFGSSVWHTMPDQGQMNVTNPFKRQGCALAFRVVRVISMEPAVPPFAVEWYSKRQQCWRSGPLPTRGEYLIRRGGSTALRSVRAVLELAPPYLAILRHEPAVPDSV
jgi:hypothetical protein